RPRRRLAHGEPQSRRVPGARPRAWPHRPRLLRRPRASERRSGGAGHLDPRPRRLRAGGRTAGRRAVTRLAAALALALAGIAGAARADVVTPRPASVEPLAGPALQLANGAIIRTP